MNDVQGLKEELERLQGQNNGLRAVCRALEDACFSSRPLGRDEMKIACRNSLRGVLDKMISPASLDDINPTSTETIKVIEEFLGRLPD